jgi:hypothetical protein
MIIFYLAIFLARGAFRDHETLDQVLGLKSAKGEMLKLEWKKDILN